MSSPPSTHAAIGMRHWARRIARVLHRRRGRDDRGSAAPRVAGGASALLVMGTVGYIATADCGQESPFGGSTNTSTVSTVGNSSGITPTLSADNVATIDTHGESANATTTVVMDIPEDVMAAHQAAARAYDIPWEILAAVAAKETHNGAYLVDGQGRPSGVERGTRNFAGAAGIMQFGVRDPVSGNIGAASNAWGGMPTEKVSERERHYEVGEVPRSMPGWTYFGIDGNNDGVVDVWDPWDNITSAAFKLAYFRDLAERGGTSCQNAGLTDPLDCALYRHNAAKWYVLQIRDVASLYEDSDEYSTIPALNIAPASFTDANNTNNADNPNCTDMQNTSFLASWGASGGVSDKHRAALEFASEQLGEPYSWGGTGPDAWDCSGLTQAAYRAAGVSIPRVTTQQWNTNDPGYGDTRAQRILEGELDMSVLQPGDLLFFHTIQSHASPSHVGLYAGNGELLHAGDPVKQVPLDTDYWRPKFVGAVRILPPDSDGGGVTEV